MPPSAKRGRAPRRANVDATHVSDEGKTPDAINTPSRSARKRGRDPATTNSSGARAAVRRKVKEEPAGDGNETDGTEAGENSDADTEPNVPTELDVISKLRTSDKFVHATQDFANDLLEGAENVPGYGKIAGRDWTFIIKIAQLQINIGRPEQNEKPEQQDLEATQGSETGQLSHKSNIDIDLGPDRQTSRLHATIAYDSDQVQWYIIVNGRNGLRLDSHLLKRGTKAVLRSGSVIDIGGTQMAFITTPTQDNQGPVFAEAILRQMYSSEDDEMDADNSKTRRFPPPPLPLQQPQAQRTVPNGAIPTPSDDNAPSSARIHPHSQASAQAASFATPGTPVRSGGNYNYQFSKPSPATAAYARGVMMDSSDSIDYAADSAKDLKPPHSYAQLIGMAILSTGEQQMTLNNIYKWIMTNYAFYRFNTGGWQNSIRHNLSLNKAFEKIARRTDEPGKGMKWMISPKERDTFLSQGMKGCRRPAHGNLGSNPSSPSQLGQISAQARPLMTAEDRPSPTTQSFGASYPSATEAFTPDRGPVRRPINGLEDNEPDLSYYPPSAKSTLNHLTAAAHAAGSPPALYTKEEGRTGLLDTPFPMRSSQKLMPPSALQQPSAFMDFSSPAPFWKFGSTPLRPLADMSPVKTPFSTFRPLGAELAGGHDIESSGSANVQDDTVVAQSSSPPPPGIDEARDASPTRNTSRPVTSHGRSGKMEASPLYQVEPAANGASAHDSTDSSAQNAARQYTAATSNALSSPVEPHSRPSTGSVDASQSKPHGVAPEYSSQPPAQNMSYAHNHTHVPALSMPRFEVDDEAGIDLMK